MTTPDDTDQLLCRIEHGDQAAIQPLMDRHRDRLKRMVTIQLLDAPEGMGDHGDTDRP